MKTFRIYFKDGNQKLYEAADILDMLQYILQYEVRDPAEIWKIEEVIK